MAMSDEFKSLLDYGAIGAVISGLIDWFITFLPPMITFVSSVLALIWLYLRVTGELRNQGYIRERKRAYTRKEDSDDDIEL